MDAGAEGQDRSGDGETADAQPWVGGVRVFLRSDLRTMLKICCV